MKLRFALTESNLDAFVDLKKDFGATVVDQGKSGECQAIAYEIDIEEEIWVCDEDGEVLDEDCTSNPK
jgi:hypothetical protein